jgi:imidazolonepropionase-like amidohydrolase
LVVQQLIARGSGIEGDPGARYGPRRVQDTLREVGPFGLPPLDAVQRARLVRLFEQRVRQVGAFNKAGVRLLAGTDAPGVAPGWSVHEELALFVRAGMSPLQSLQTATLNVARYFEATDSAGTVEAGKVADLVLLDANPLDDIANTRRIRAVVANGRYFSRAALDSILQRAER